MKPIKLIISAIGPYAKTMPAIDFGQFENDGLFLISGETGAGKTTIFDAICFALFGQVSGNYRDTKYLRSELADKETPSFVDFYFSHQGKNYHIQRNPSYMRPKERGSGFKEEPEKAVLYPENENPLEGKKNVDTAIAELLNISFKQFKQVAMIAQGEFWELLNASTDDRTKILRNIFLTDGYEKISYELKSMMNESYGEAEDKRKAIIQYFDGVKTESDTESEEKFADFIDSLTDTKTLWNIEDMFSLIDKIISEDKLILENKGVETEESEKNLKKIRDEISAAEANNSLFADFDRYKDQLERLEKKKSENEQLKVKVDLFSKASTILKPLYDSYIEKFNANEALQNEIAENKSEHKKIKINLEAAEKNLSELKKKEPLLKDYEIKTAEIENNKNSYIERDEVSEKLETDKKSLSKLQEEKSAFEELKNESNKKLTETEKKYAELKDSTNLLHKAEQEALKFEKAENDIDALIITAERLIISQKNIRDEQAELLKKEQAYKEASDRRVHFERILDGSRAGILASLLKEGCPCPVCGSTIHPDPASLPESSITEEEFEAYKEKEEEARNEKEEEVRKIEGMLSSFNTSVEAVKEDYQNFSDEDYGLDCENISNDWEKNRDIFGKISEYIKTEAVKLSDRLKKERKRRKEFLEAEEILEELRKKEIPEIDKNIELTSGKLELVRIRVSEEESTLKALKRLEYESWSEAQKELERLRKEILNIKNSILQAEKDFNENGKKESGLRSVITKLEESLKNNKKLEDEKKEIFTSEREKYFETDEIFKSNIREQTEIDSIRKSISDYESNLKSAGLLLDEAKKKTEGKSLIDLEEKKSREKELNKKYKDFVRKSNEIEGRIKSNFEIRKKIESNAGDYEENRRLHQIHRRLYDLVSGNVAKSGARISLEQYVQTTGFDAIIAAANKRLLPMSDGQFELYRKQNIDNRKSKEILDLEVLDNFTGKRRPVGNLSGGESFKASLSLALGLSDTVSQNSGGIQMDALFVDEGFGTLDRKSIDGAMEILMSLSGKGKLVGIISHREELIENIPRQIHIVKTKEGSEIL
ncbi:MAG: AAA family ATPase [Lachnospiraceae bacterium]|nr:AAA family ATPase [Lachnospiraceae bacterium]